MAESSALARSETLLRAETRPQHLECWGKIGRRYPEGGASRQNLALLDLEWFQ